MKTSGIHLLIYDIGEDKVRAKVAKIAAGFGVRVQKSAFECRLTRGLRTRLWGALSVLSLAEDDRIALYPLAASPANRRGSAVEDEPMSESHHAVVL